ncbi:MAG: hypothetical protein U0T73_11185 [Chitinophagales bacterium]
MNYYKISYAYRKPESTSLEATRVVRFFAGRLEAVQELILRIHQSQGGSANDRIVWSGTNDISEREYQRTGESEKFFLT